MFKQLFVISLIGFQSWLQYSRHRLQILAKTDSVTSKPKEVIRWEGEGGSLPVTGSQMGPNPKLSGQKTNQRKNLK